MRALYFIIFFIISVSTYGQINTDPVKKEISLYPNPAKTTLWVNIDNSEITSDNLAVYNIIGNKLQVPIEKIDEGKFAIEVNDLPSGYYLLVVENESIQFTKTVKFLKK